MVNGDWIFEAKPRPLSTSVCPVFYKNENSLFFFFTEENESGNDYYYSYTVLFIL